MQTLAKKDPEKLGMIVKRVSVPIGLEELMEGLTKEVLLKKPKDLYIFASEYFSRLVILRERNSNHKAYPIRSVQSITQLKTSDAPKGKKLPPPRPTKHLSRQLSVQTNQSEPAKKAIQKNREKKQEVVNTKRPAKRERSSSTKTSTPRSNSSVQTTPRDKKQQRSTSRPGEPKTATKNGKKLTPKPTNQNKEATNKEILDSDVWAASTNLGSVAKTVEKQNIEDTEVDIVKNALKETVKDGGQNAVERLDDIKEPLVNIDEETKDHKNIAGSEALAEENDGTKQTNSIEAFLNEERALAIASEKEEESAKVVDIEDTSLATPIKDKSASEKEDIVELKKEEETAKVVDIKMEHMGGSDDLLTVSISDKLEEPPLHVQAPVEALVEAPPGIQKTQFFRENQELAAKEDGKVIQTDNLAKRVINFNTPQQMGRLDSPTKSFLNGFLSSERQHLFRASTHEDVATAAAPPKSYSSVKDLLESSLPSDDSSNNLKLIIQHTDSSDSNTKASSAEIDGAASSMLSRKSSGLRNKRSTTSDDIDEITSYAEKSSTEQTSSKEDDNSKSEAEHLLGNTADEIKKIILHEANSESEADVTHKTKDLSSEQRIAVDESNKNRSSFKAEAEDLQASELSNKQNTDNKSFSKEKSESIFSHKDEDNIEAKTTLFEAESKSATSSHKAEDLQATELLSKQNVATSDRTEETTSKKESASKSAADELLNKSNADKIEEDKTFKFEAIANSEAPPIASENEDLQTIYDNIFGSSKAASQEEDRTKRAIEEQEAVSLESIEGKGISKENTFVKEAEAKRKPKIGDIDQIASVIEVVKNIYDSKASSGASIEAVREYLHQFLQNEQENVFKPKTEEDNNNNKKKKSKLKFRSKQERSLSQTTLITNNKTLPPPEAKVRRARSVGVIKTSDREVKSRIPTARRSAGRRPLVRQLEADSKELEEKLMSSKKSSAESDDTLIAKKILSGVEGAENNLKNEAATTIQKTWKGFRTRRTLQEDKTHQESAALKIQSLWRGFNTRKMLSKSTHQEKAILILQAMVRGFLERRRYIRMKQEVEAEQNSSQQKATVKEANDAAQTIDKNEAEQSSQNKKQNEGEDQSSGDQTSRIVKDKNLHQAEAEEKPANQEKLQNQIEKISEAENEALNRSQEATTNDTHKETENAAEYSTLKIESKVEDKDEADSLQKQNYEAENKVHSQLTETEKHLEVPVTEQPKLAPEAANKLESKDMEQKNAIEAEKPVADESHKEAENVAAANDLNKLENEKIDNTADEAKSNLKNQLDKTDKSGNQLQKDDKPKIKTPDQLEAAEYRVNNTSMRGNELENKAKAKNKDAADDSHNEAETVTEKLDGQLNNEIKPENQTKTENNEKTDEAESNIQTQLIEEAEKTFNQRKDDNATDTKRQIKSGDVSHEEAKNAAENKLKNVADEQPNNPSKAVNKLENQSKPENKSAADEADIDIQNQLIKKGDTPLNQNKKIDDIETKIQNQLQTAAESHKEAENVAEKKLKNIIEQPNENTEVKNKLENQENQAKLKNKDAADEAEIDMQNQLVEEANKMYDQHKTQNQLKAADGSHQKAENAAEIILKNVNEQLNNATEVANKLKNQRKTEDKDAVNEAENAAERILKNLVNEQLNNATEIVSKLENQAKTDNKNATDEAETDMQNQLIEADKIVDQHKKDSESKIKTQNQLRAANGSHQEAENAAELILKNVVNKQLNNAPEAVSKLENQAKTHNKDATDEAETDMQNQLIEADKIVDQHKKDSESKIKTQNQLGAANGSHQEAENAAELILKNIVNEQLNNATKVASKLENQGNTEDKDAANEAENAAEIILKNLVNRQLSNAPEIVSNLENEAKTDNKDAAVEAEIDIKNQLVKPDKIVDQDKKDSKADVKTQHQLEATDGSYQEAENAAEIILKNVVNKQLNNAPEAVSKLENQAKTHSKDATDEAETDMQNQLIEADKIVDQHKKNSESEIKTQNQLGAAGGSHQEAENAAEIILKNVVNEQLNKATEVASKLENQAKTNDKNATDEAETDMQNQLVEPDKIVDQHKKNTETEIKTQNQLKAEDDSHQEAENAAKIILKNVVNEQLNNATEVASKLENQEKTDNKDAAVEAEIDIKNQLVELDKIVDQHKKNTEPEIKTQNQLEAADGSHQEADNAAEIILKNVNEQLNNATEVATKLENQGKTEDKDAANEAENAAEIILKNVVSKQLSNAPEIVSKLENQAKTDNKDAAVEAKIDIKNQLVEPDKIVDQHKKNTETEIKTQNQLEAADGSLQEAENAAKIILKNVVNEQLNNAPETVSKLKNQAKTDAADEAEINIQNQLVKADKIIDQHKKDRETEIKTQNQSEATDGSHKEAENAAENLLNSLVDKQLKEISEAENKLTNKIKLKDEADPNSDHRKEDNEAEIKIQSQLQKSDVINESPNEAEKQLQAENKHNSQSKIEDISQQIEAEIVAKHQRNEDKQLHKEAENAAEMFKIRQQDNVVKEQPNKAKIEDKKATDVSLQNKRNEAENTVQAQGGAAENFVVKDFNKEVDMSKTEDTHAVQKADQEQKIEPKTSTDSETERAAEKQEDKVIEVQEKVVPAKIEAENKKLNSSDLQNDAVEKIEKQLKNNTLDDNGAAENKVKEQQNKIEDKDAAERSKTNIDIEQNEAEYNTQNQLLKSTVNDFNKEAANGAAENFSREQLKEIEDKDAAEITKKIIIDKDQNVAEKFGVKEAAVNTNKEDQESAINGDKEQSLKKNEDLEANARKPDFYRSNTVVEPALIKKNIPPLGEPSEESPQPSSEEQKDDNNNASKEETELEKEVRGAVQEIVNHKGGEEKQLTPLESEIDQAVKHIMENNKHSDSIDEVLKQLPEIPTEEIPKAIVAADSSGGGGGTEEPLDDVSSVGSVDSIVTVVLRPKQDSNERLDHLVEPKPAGKKPLGKALSTSALEDHVELIDQVQNSLLDQLSGKSPHSPNKYDLELYKGEHHDHDNHEAEAMEYLYDFHQEDDDAYDSRVVRTPLRELPDIAEEAESKEEDPIVKTRFCGEAPKGFKEKVIEGKPLEDHVEMIDVHNIKISKAPSSLLHSSELHDSVIIPVSGKSSQRTYDDTANLKHTSEFHDTVVVPLPSGSDVKIKNASKTSTPENAMEANQANLVDNGNQTSPQQAPGQVFIIIQVLRS